MPFDDAQDSELCFVKAASKYIKERMFSMKKIVSLLLVLFMVFSLIGCARRTDDDPDRMSNKSITTEEDKNKKDKDKKEETSKQSQEKGNNEEGPEENESGKSGTGGNDKPDKGNTDDIKVNINITGEPVPESFRTDILPIPDGTVIISTYSDAKANSMGYSFHSVHGKSEYKPEDIAAFYEKWFKDAEDFSPGKSFYPYILNAKVDNVEIAVQITVEKKDGFKSEIELMMKVYDSEVNNEIQEFYPEEDPNGQSGTTGGDTIAGGNATRDDIFSGGNADAIKSVNTNITGEPIPKGFDTDLVPIPGGSMISLTSSYEEGGNKIYGIYGLCEYEVKDLVAFYKKVMQDAEGLIEDPMSYSYFIEGRLNGVYIAMYISDDEYDEFKSSFEIQMDFN